MLGVTGGGSPTSALRHTRQSLTPKQKKKGTKVRNCEGDWQAEPSLGFADIWKGTHHWQGSWSTAELGREKRGVKISSGFFWDPSDTQVGAEHPQTPNPELQDPSLALYQLIPSLRHQQGMFSGDLSLASVRFQRKRGWNRLSFEIPPTQTTLEGFKHTNFN